jgi:proline dehydrogenase
MNSTGAPATDTVRLDLENTQLAYRAKTDTDLRRARFLYQVLTREGFSRLGNRLLKWAVDHKLPVNPIIRATLFKQFIGGESIDDCRPLIRRLARHGVYTTLDFSAEGGAGEAKVRATMDEVHRNIDLAAEEAYVPFTVFKPTAITDTELLRKVSAGEMLHQHEQKAYGRLEERFDAIFGHAADRQVRVFIDAEESWLQAAIDQLALRMMRRYNTDRPIVWNTYQMYRVDRLGLLTHHLQTAEKAGFVVGAKLVRGAYMDKERRRAEAQGYPDPIQPTKADTDHAYDQAQRLCLDRLEHVGFICASHNEASNRLLAEEMVRREIPRDHPHIWFGQLYGMCDHLTFNLAAAGYNASKYVPYGPIESVIPYLVRRAEENASVNGQAGREIDLLNRELRRRLRETS